MPKYDYASRIEECLNASGGTGTIHDLDDVLAKFPGVSEQTARKHVKKFISAERARWGCIAGLFPDTSAILDEVERTLQGGIQGATLVQANETAKAIVDDLSKKFRTHFCKKTLGSNLCQNTGNVSLSFDDLVSQLLVPYENYLTQSGNGLVSIAGTLNQSLLVRALRNSGLNDSGAHPDFKETGTKSEGDIKVFCRHGNEKTLHVEAKSYAARERLLRGLSDIPQPKVGVGFFNDPSEFGEDRVTLIATTAHASAIYMPQNTLDALSTGAKGVIIPGSGRVCRSLETEFVEDMKNFVAKGDIKKR